MIKLSTYIFQVLESRNINTVFMVTGGGAMHLNDSIAKNKNLKVFYTHHEQGASIAAEGFARVSNKPAILNVTTGPGSINALNGVHGAYTDSMPMIVISGQVKKETLASSYDLDGIRQLGDQEVDIISMVKGITKYAHEVLDPNSIRYHLEKAIFLATNKRPGPVWLSIPVDIQGKIIDDSKLIGFKPTKEIQINNDVSIKKIIDKLIKSKRPVIICSTGIRIANAINELEKFIDITGIPIVTAWCHDIIYHNHNCYIGKQGSIGNRAGNFAVQNADLVLIIGSRMPIRQVSYNWENFAKHAYKIQIDIDPLEIQKPFIKINLGVVIDAKLFLEKIIEEIKLNNVVFDFNQWLKWCQERKQKYPVLQSHHLDRSKPLNPYNFLSQLDKVLNSDDIIVCGNASACIVPFQTINIKKGQQLFSNSGSASMGYDLPAAIGASVSNPKKRIICIAGDGSIMMNLQELETIKNYNLNIKIIILNNEGYLSIKSTQKSFFGQEYGSGLNSGISFPNFNKIGDAFSIKNILIDKDNFKNLLEDSINERGPIILNVKLDPNQGFEPKLSSKKLPNGELVSSSLEDMYPFLNEDELNTNIYKNEK